MSALSIVVLVAVALAFVAMCWFIAEEAGLLVLAVVLIAPGALTWGTYFAFNALAGAL